MKFYYIFSKISEGFKFYEHMDSSDKGSEYNPIIYKDSLWQISMIWNDSILIYWLFSNVFTNT
mgnify:CR=1 FL=1